MVIDEIEQIMGMDDGQDFFNQNDMMVNSSMEGNGFQDGEIGLEQMLMAGFENIMKGNEDCHKINEHNDCPPVVMESGTIEVSKSSEKVKDQSSSLKTNLVHEKNEIQQKEMELENIFPPMRECVLLVQCLLVNESIDILLDDTVVSGKKVEKLISGGSFDDKHPYCNGETTVSDEFTFVNTNVAPIANKATPGGFKRSETGQMVYELGMMQRKEGGGRIQKQIGHKNRVIETKSKLGVKRLKLQAVLKPKTVTYCRHYLKGRCHEGEKCKFSHDTVPLTKSQMRDDCPFDHQVSKYPCINYTTKGSCSRGDDCLFSHKKPLEGDVASLSVAPDLPLKSSLQSDSDKGLNISRARPKNANASFYSLGGFSDKSRKQIVADTPAKTPNLACKGVNFLFVSKSSIAESIKLSQGSLSKKINESGRVGIPSNQRMLGVSGPASKPSPAESSKIIQGSSSLKNGSGRLGIQGHQSESHTIQNGNDSPKKKPEMVPRGINFLSFGKSSLEDAKNLTEDSTRKVSLADTEGRGKFSSQLTPITSNIDQKKTHLAVVLPGINLTLRKLVSSKNNVNNGSHPKINYTVEWLAHKSKPNSAHEALISTLAVAKKMPASLLTKSQSTEKIAPKSTPNSSQKALMSTLAFTIMFEFGMKKNQSAFRTATKTDTAKTWKLSDILSSVGSKIK
ncbi:hypothetical protein ES288_A10G074100v1 [Gossypium darwinii]|uniref:C3H1-type domain-containing protein n=1 Tax=Gossypium darwinii TaxID=34276 RepID=A0A5D2EWB5_GOSDA|nr:hypothetical protein ES288_A10G074100v1 [Gossypium darwinii]